MAADGLGRIGVIVAARTGSRRLPGKVLLPLCGVPMIELLLERLAGSDLADEIVLATTKLNEDDRLVELVEISGVRVFRGPSDDVVARYVAVAKACAFDTVVRVTGDCPLVDAASLDYCINKAKGLMPFDLATTKGHFPVGIDYEIYPGSCMAEQHLSASLTQEEREHLTLHMVRNRNEFNVRAITPDPEWYVENATFTIDTAEDYARITTLVTRLGKCNFSIAELAQAARYAH